jgi:tRNA C32,U32 (ribose-2'-O)-methylase TrmJ
MNLNHVSIVLVEPQGAQYRSVCQAMMNFGFCDLRLSLRRRIIRR